MSKPDLPTGSSPLTGRPATPPERRTPSPVRGEATPGLPDPPPLPLETTPTEQKAVAERIPRR